MTEIHERWVFTRTDLKHPKRCKAGDEFVALLRTETSGVLVRRNGSATTRWADGTEGVPDTVQKDVDAEEILYTAVTLNEADVWRDVVADRDGNFIRFEE